MSKNTYTVIHRLLAAWLAVGGFAAAFITIAGFACAL